MARTKLPPPVRGLQVVWSNVNRAYFITLCGLVLRVINDRNEAIAAFEEIAATPLPIVGGQDA